MKTNAGQGSFVILDVESLGQLPATLKSRRFAAVGAAPPSARKLRTLLSSKSSIFTCTLLTLLYVS